MNKQKIAVGISGGVDSSVAAYLLKQEGHEVIGVFVKTWSPEWLPCTWVDEKRDAMRVCAALDIPFHFLDAEEEYKKDVADYMIAEYRAGRTPNPDVLCNRVIKFGALWEYSKSCGADAVTTGHYAQIIERQPPENHSHILKNMRMMVRGADKAKDQSYFLWMLEAAELGHIRFPIGHLQKSEVRKIAERAGIFTATKKDSQGICFLGDVDMREFLSHYIEEKKGDVLDEQGNVIGEHDGVWFHTLGSRHGYRITSTNTSRKPMYVVAKDIERNTITVGPSMNSGNDTVTVQKVLLREVNWLAAPVPAKPYTAQIRYHGKHIECTIDGDIVALKTTEALPLGNNYIIYDDETLLGGGIIDKIA